MWGNRAANNAPARLQTRSQVVSNIKAIMPRFIGLQRIGFFLKVLTFSASLSTVNSVIFDGVIV